MNRRTLVVLLCAALAALLPGGARAAYGRPVRGDHLCVRPGVRMACGPVREAVRITLPMPVHLRYAYPGAYLARTRLARGQVRAARHGPPRRRGPASRYARPGPMYRPGYGRTPARIPQKLPRPSRLKGERGRALRHALAARDGGRCFYCRRGVSDPTTLTLDHYIPVMWARRHGWRGVHDMCNLVLACQPCNRAKGNTLPWPLAWVLLARFRPRAGQLAAAA